MKNRRRIAIGFMIALVLLGGFLISGCSGYEHDDGRNSGNSGHHGH
ncbi:MAG: hypothetical protein HZA48_09980 [Planctomycetes bacterium]|nr:hypothetical protein [Planctomycetota bacterium]